MPLKRIKPGQRIDDYTGPKLDEFVKPTSISNLQTEPPKEVSHYINPSYRLEQEMRKRGFSKAKGPREHYYEKPVPNETWKFRVWLAEPWQQIKTWGAYYSDDPRSSEYVGGGATMDEAIDALLRRLDLPKARETEGERAASPSKH